MLNKKEKAFYPSMDPLCLVKIILREE